jgi:hypothetical protein
MKGLIRPPSEGGLLVTNREAPYGSRAFPLEGGGYGGSMMPKTKGWQGLIPSLDGERFITEFSLGGIDGEPFYPMVTQNMTPEQIESVRRLEAGLITYDSEEAQGLQRNALEEYYRHMTLDESPFLD